MDNELRELIIEGISRAYCGLWFALGIALGIAWSFVFWTAL